MKYLLLLLLLVGCASRTEYGECVGISDKQDPTLVYKPSAQNIIAGVIFAEMLFPPIIVLTSEFYCHIDKQEKK